MQSNHKKPGNDLKAIQKIFNEIAVEFDITRYKPWPQTVEFIESLPKGGTILDLGCGNGRNIKYLASVGKNLKIIGLDFSIRMLRIAREKVKQLGLEKNMDLILGDVIQLPLKNKSMDGAIFVAALHHIPSSNQRLASLMELERVLRPKASAFISVWDFEQERFETELEKQLNDPPKEGEFGDVYVPWLGKRGMKQNRFYHLFYKDELEELINQTKLKILKLFRAADNYHALVEKS
jgi:ubiquinone/menaquinone biosynthesis C-methylase UbiE